LLARTSTGLLPGFVEKVGWLSDVNPIIDQEAERAVMGFANLPAHLRCAR
jgi:hypothetical protein